MSNPVWTEERVKLMRHLWPRGVSRAVLFMELNQLEGKPIKSEAVLYRQLWQRGICRIRGGHAAAVRPVVEARRTPPVYVLGILAEDVWEGQERALAGQSMEEIMDWFGWTDEQYRWAMQFDTTLYHAPKSTLCKDPDRGSIPA